jgi:hypothetical protein
MAGNTTIGSGGLQFTAGGLASDTTIRARRPSGGRRRYERCRQRGSTHWKVPPFTAHTDVAPNFYPAAIGVWRSTEPLPILGPPCWAFSRVARSGRAECH